LSGSAAIAEYAAKFAELAPLLDQKQKELENELVLKQLLFDIEEQIKWIEQTSRQLNLLTSTPPQTLFDATNVNKKVNELERSLLNNHKPNVDKLLNQSKLMTINDKKGELAVKTEQLETEWLRLLKDVELKKYQMGRALMEQQCLDELNQIMSGLSEKWLIIENENVMQSQDEVLLNKHMAKLNQLKDDLKGYNVSDLKGFKDHYCYKLQ
jgi:phosphatidate phosphatase PAH1